MKCSVCKIDTPFISCRKADVAAVSVAGPVASGSELKRRMKRNHDDDKEEGEESKSQGNGTTDVEMEVEVVENGGSRYENGNFQI